CHTSPYALSLHDALPILTIIPMFILLGVFAVRAKVAEQVFTIARRVFRKIPGGIGIATVAACAGFAAVSGSSIGTAATMSRLSRSEEHTSELQSRFDVVC